MKYIKFEDLPVWQEARKFVGLIYSTITTNKKFKSDFSLCDQIKRASYSIMLNIAEGFERGSNKDFSHFIDYAKGSAGETRAILYIALDNNYLSKNEFDGLMSKIESISTQLSNFKKFLIKNDFKKQF